MLRQRLQHAAFGKWHETAPWEISVSGPFDRWPTHSGFDKFYGFIGGETDQWDPLIYQRPIKSRASTRCELSLHRRHDEPDDQWVRSQQSMTPDKPFFTYYATGAAHAPHHVPKEWVEKYKGQFDKGWDQVPHEIVERQKNWGISREHEAGGKAYRPEGLGPLPADQRRLFARQMEVFAAFLEHTDYEIGRVIKAIEDIGELDNT